MEGDIESVITDAKDCGRARIKNTKTKKTESLTGVLSFYFANGQYVLYCKAPPGAGLLLYSDILEFEDGAYVLTKAGYGLVLAAAADFFDYFKMKVRGAQYRRVIQPVHVKLEIGPHLSVEGGLELVVDKLVSGEGYQRQVEVEGVVPVIEGVVRGQIFELVLYHVRQSAYLGGGDIVKALLQTAALYQQAVLDDVPDVLLRVAGDLIAVTGDAAQNALTAKVHKGLPDGRFAHLKLVTQLFFVYQGIGRIVALHYSVQHMSEYLFL